MYATDLIMESNDSEIAGEGIGIAVREMNIFLAKTDLMMESCERELSLNIASSELKCLKESGTRDDYLYLVEAAEEGFRVKVRKIIDKVVEMWKNFIENIKLTVMRMLTSAQAKATIKSMNKKVKLNPILKRKRVEFHDCKRALSVINHYKSEADKLCTKVVKGLITENQPTTLLDVKENFRKDMKKAIAGRASLGVMTVGAAIAQLSSETDRLPHFIEGAHHENSVALERLKACNISPEAEAAATMLTQQVAAFRTEIAKEEVNQHIEKTLSIIKALKEAVKTVGKKVAEKSGKKVMHTVNRKMEESGEDIESFMDNIFESSESEDDTTENEDSFEESENESDEDESFSFSKFEESADEPVDDDTAFLKSILGEDF